MKNRLVKISITEVDNGYVVAKLYNDDEIMEVCKKSESALKDTMYSVYKKSLVHDIEEEKRKREANRK